MTGKILEKELLQNQTMQQSKKNKHIYVIPLLSLIFPIISIEGLVPWAVAVYFCYKGFKAIAQFEKPLKRCLSYTVISGIAIALYNILVYLISNYLVKLLM